MMLESTLNRWTQAKLLRCSSTSSFSFSFYRISLFKTAKKENRKVVIELSSGVVNDIVYYIVHELICFCYDNNND